jgi:hypothetical protein
MVILNLILAGDNYQKLTCAGIHTFEKLGKIIWHFLPTGGSMVRDIFCTFYFVKIYKTANNSTITKAALKNKCRFGILRI